MTSLLVRNAQVVTLDDENRVIDGGSVYVEDDKIMDVGNLDADALAPDRTIDAGGKLLMPGLIIAHHHLYSTLARGFTPPGPPATNFDENLRFLWWKLDAALDSDDVYYSALLALMDAALAGCTTVIDHHASPAVCDGSLDWVERAFTDVGLSGCLCYEVSDRNKPGQGIEENERFIRKCQGSDDDQVTALFGLHALMTLGNDTLERSAAAAQSLNTGFHVHAAEYLADVELAMERHGQTLMERFEQFGIPDHQVGLFLKLSDGLLHALFELILGFFQLAFKLGQEIAAVLVFRIQLLLEFLEQLLYFVLAPEGQALGEAGVEHPEGEGRVHPLVDAREVRTGEGIVLRQELARHAVAIEQHYSELAGMPRPMDIEWARDGKSGELHIVQARPETVHSIRSDASQEIFTLPERGRVLTQGKAVGARIGAGEARIILEASHMHDLQPGEVLITRRAVMAAACRAGEAQVAMQDPAPASRDIGAVRDFLAEAGIVVRVIAGRLVGARDRKLIR